MGGRWLHKVSDSLLAVPVPTQATHSLSSEFPSVARAEF